MIRLKLLLLILIGLSWSLTTVSVPSAKNDTSHIYFNSGSYKIRALEANLLNHLSKKLKASENRYTIRISGNCDSIGSDAYNDKLSLQRANAVKSRLIQSGIKEGSMEISGYGKRKPINKKSKIPLYSAFEFVSHFCQSLVSSKYFQISISCQFFISCLF